MRVYSEREPIPVAVVTLATQESSRQHILFQTRYDQEGFHSLQGEDIEKNREKYKQEDCPTKLEWAIKATTVSLFRDWSQSMARIHLACPVDEATGRIPRLPRVDKFRGGQYPFLTVDDEIRIYAGYVSSPNEPVDGDMLDEIPFPVLRDVNDPETNTTKSIPMEDIPQPTPGKKLVPIFWGFIDKIDFDGSAKGSGLQCVISCRDRTRVLSDTTLINIPSLNGVFGSNNTGVTLPQGRLSQIISDVARSVNGFQINIDAAQQKDLNCWKTILTPNPALNEYGQEAKDRDEDIEVASELCEYYSAYDLANGDSRQSSLNNDFTADPALFVRRASFKVMDPLSRPRFHMWLSRPPMAKNGTGNTWQVLDQTPLKIIKWVATKEERPTDFFASHVNGDFCLVPRVLDTSGFRDDCRMYRTYFFRDYPRLTAKRDETGKVIGTVEVAPPCRNQLILNLRSHTSIVGTYNRFTVVDNSNTSGAGLALLEGVKLTIDRLPFILDGEKNEDNPELSTERKPTPPCRQKIIYDGNLANYPNQYGAALIVAQQASSHFARDMSGIEFTLIGDPTFYPGEAVRIYNTFLHDAGYQSQSGNYFSILDKHTATEEFLTKWSKESPDAAGIANQGKNVKAVLPNAKDSKKVKQLQEISTQVTNIENNDLKLPVYKVRSIEHRIKTQGRNAGYTTIISASMDLNN